MPDRYKHSRRLGAVANTGFCLLACAALVWVGWVWTGLAIASLQALAWTWLAASYRQIAEDWRRLSTPEGERCHARGI